MWKPVLECHHGQSLRSLSGTVAEILSAEISFYTVECAMVIVLSGVAGKTCREVK
jgi:hypothetical protein